MGAYLIDHPPVRDQFYKSRNRPLTGCTVLHTAESVMDTVGPDTGAESVAEFIRTRTTPGSYHDLADSDSYINLVPYQSGAYHDGTGSNNWALSISFACGTHHWRAMTPARRRAFLRQGARAFADQQAWRKGHGYQPTKLRRITKAQSDAGESGFIYHGDRDPGRRTDPGKNAPNLFPWDEWITECGIALGIIEEDDMTPEQAKQLDAIHANALTTNATVGKLNVAIRDPKGGLLVKVASLSGQVAGQAAALEQLAAMQGTPIDMAAIEAAVEKSVKDAIESIETTIRVSPTDAA